MEANIPIRDQIPFQKQLEATSRVAHHTMDGERLESSLVGCLFRRLHFLSSVASVNFFEANSTLPRGILCLQSTEVCLRATTPLLFLFLSSTDADTMTLSLVSSVCPLLRDAQTPALWVEDMDKWDHKMNSW